MDPLVIRVATRADAEAVIANINAVCTEEIFLQTDHFVPNAQWDIALSGSGPTPGYLILVAELNGKIVGIARLFPGSCGSKDKHTAELGTNILREYRNRGIGTRLVAETLAWARAQGYEKITLSVFSTNARAIHVYEKLGFEREGVRRKQFRVRGEYVDDVLMAKFL